MISLSRRARHEYAVSVWLAGPATLVMVLFIFVPVAIVALFSFTDYQFGARTLNWIGLDNYAELFGSKLGRKAVTNTLLYVAVVIPSSIILSLLVAMGLHRMIEWWPALSRLLRTVYFLPVAATLVAMAIAWQMLLHPTLGLVNSAIVEIGLKPQNWLSDRSLVIYTLSVIGIWQTVGYNMVLFLAGLSAIPNELYEAAEIDGSGGAWFRFWTVTWPMLGPTTLFVLIITATRAFSVFETVATLTEGGPAFASDTLVYALYREGFIYFKAGYSSAITMVFFATLLILTLAQLRVVERRVHYR